MLPRVLCLLVLLSPCAAHAEDLSPGPWRLLIDQQAEWKADKIFLPDEVDLQKLPVHPPTGGWEALNGKAGIPVTLPSTVEEHYWGKLDPRPYNPDDEYAWPQDKYLQNGNYLGVSWWYRTFSAPGAPAGRRLLLHLQGSRLRTEIYVNGKLCGYSILTELPVDADITAAVHPGADNQLAIRITNPGGRWDWRDGRPFNWGAYAIPSSIGAGGLDTGVALDVVNATRVADLAVLNKPDPHDLELRAEVANAGADFTGDVLFTIKDAKGTVAKTLTVRAAVPAGATKTFTAEAALDSARLWTLDDPTLYTATAELADVPDSAAARIFGFRSFEATGIGTDAMLRLNRKRIVIRSAISWGFWAPNGIWPTAETAQRELETAKAMGLNCIQSHRNLSKTAVLDSQDRGGLLRYEEPGAGITSLGAGAGPANNKDVRDTSGDGGEPKTFTEKYEEDKILAMVKRDRSHPSLIMYCIQNEVHANLHDARIYNVMRKMHALDPSRIVVLKSGIAAAYEVFMLPYNDTVYVDDGTGYCGWRDEHTVGGPGTWSRSLYIDPTNFSHRSDDRKQIVMWGEMLGTGTPDDNRRIVADYARTDATGYDRDDHATLDRAYAGFLQIYGFTAAFPTTSALYRSIADKGYYEWQRMLENTRMCDATDDIVISGWESTSIENHSGLVDAHRVAKNDPAILKRATDPVMLVVRPRRYILSTHEGVTVDVFLVNELDLKGPAKLTLTATGPDGRALFNDVADVNVTGGDVFGQLLKAGYQIPGSGAGGDVTLTAALAPAGPLPAGVKGADLTRSEKVAVIDPAPGPLPQRIALAESTGEIARAFAQFYHAPVLPAGALLAGEPVDAIIFSNFTTRGRLKAVEPVQGTDDPGLYLEEAVAGTGLIGSWSGFAPGPLKVELFLAELAKDAANQRVSTIVLNDQVVLKSFDLFQAAKGKNRAYVGNFEVAAPNGTLTLRVQALKDQTAIAALRVTDATGKVRRIVFRDAPYTDPRGDQWEASNGQNEGSNPALFAAALRQVHDSGARLVIWPDRGGEALAAAKLLAEQKIVQVNGSVGNCRAAWMGTWYFVRQNPIFDGLPVDTALDHRYELPHQGTGEDGLLLDAAGMQVFVGYGRDHDPTLGIGLCVIPYGKGRIVLSSIGSEVAGLGDSATSLPRPIALRLLSNAVRMPLP
jgi:beta-galactosidase